MDCFAEPRKVPRTSQLTSTGTKLRKGACSSVDGHGSYFLSGFSLETQLAMVKSNTALHVSPSNTN